MRFKSQPVQNLPLTGIKASNLISSVARRGREGLMFFPPLPQVKEEEEG